MSIEALTFEEYAADQAKHAALATVEAHAAESWTDRATEVLRGIAFRQHQITSDDLRDELDCLGIETHDLRAIANPFLRLQKQHILTQSSDRAICRHKSRNGTRIPIWISNVCGPGMAS